MKTEDTSLSKAEFVTTTIAISLAGLYLFRNQLPTRGMLTASGLNQSTFDSILNNKLLIKGQEVLEKLENNIVKPDYSKPDQSLIKCFFQFLNEGYSKSRTVYSDNPVIVRDRNNDSLLFRLCRSFPCTFDQMVTKIGDDRIGIDQMLNQISRDKPIKAFLKIGKDDPRFLNSSYRLESQIDCLAQGIYPVSKLDFKSHLPFLFETLPALQIIPEILLSASIHAFQKNSLLRYFGRKWGNENIEFYFYNDGEILLKDFPKKVKELAEIFDALSYAKNEAEVNEILEFAPKAVLAFFDGNTYNRTKRDERTLRLNETRINSFQMKIIDRIYSNQIQLPSGIFPSLDNQAFVLWSKNLVLSHFKSLIENSN